MDVKIEITDGLATVNYEKNHVNYSKTMTTETLVGSLASQYGIKTPLLPPGCCYYEKRGAAHVMILEIPPVPRLVRYVNNSSKPIFEGVVPFPWALFQFSAYDTDNGQFRTEGGRIFALRGPLLSDSDQIYHFPAANVFNNQGICWGSTFNTESRDVKTLRKAGRLIDLYFSSDFNTHIHPRINVYARYEDMLRAMKDEKTFDPNVLVPIDNMTFGTLVSSLQNNV